MQRTFHSFRISRPEILYNKMLNWLSRCGIFCLLDSGPYSAAAYPLIAGAGADEYFEGDAGNAFPTLQRAVDTGEWLFGHIGYDCKNEIERLQSRHPDYTGFPGLFFFRPQTILKMHGDVLEIGCYNDRHHTVYDEIMACPGEIPRQDTAVPQIHSRFSKQEYIDTVERLKQHIRRGDCYEINFCQEFWAAPCLINPVHAYRALTSISPNPFSALYRVRNQYLMCASPERFLKKTGAHILSQPIKGTVKRSPGNEAADLELRNALLASPKEKSENVMVVDLVRNDLSKICSQGSVQVDELFGVYSFPQVHHLISTVSGQLSNPNDVAGAIKACFPMASMTGAPKKRVMELIEQYERTRRGIFSGAVGYIDPDRNFDFNVVIRSIMYNAATQYLSYQAGSGITTYCDAEKEYEECLLKAKAIEAVLKR